MFSECSVCWVKLLNRLSKKAMIIERSQKKLLTQRIESEPRQFIQVLYCPRQVGKTTVAYSYFPITASRTRCYWSETRGFHGRSFLNWNLWSCLREGRQLHHGLLPFYFFYKQERFYYDRSRFETGRWVSLGAVVVALLKVVGGVIIWKCGN